VFGVASVGALLADSAAGVIAVRAAMGIGAALIMPATLSIIANVFSGEERGKAIGIWAALAAIGIWAALAAIGIGLGPLVGGLLLHWFAWWSVFLLNVPVAAAALALGVRYVPESRDPGPGSFDLRGAALSTLGFTALVYGIVEAPRDGWLSAPVLASFAIAGVLLGTFVWWERRIAEPMVDLGFFRNRRFSVGTAAVSITFFAMLGGIFAITQYLQFAHGYSTIQAGALMTPMAIGLMVGAGSSHKAVARLGTARVVATGMTGVAAALALTTLWTPHTGAGWLIAWFFGLTLAMGWIMAPATDAVVGAVPAAKAGIASATNTVARMVAGALGVAIVGSLVSSLYSDDLRSSLHGAPSGATDSIGAASAVAHQLPPRAGSALLATAANSFSDAMGSGLLVAAGLAALGAALVLALLRRPPGRPLRVVVVGGGFGGLKAVRHLRRARAQVTLIDRRNFHLFQPLAYQVATGALSADEIAMPLRAIFKRRRDVSVVLGEVTGFDVAAHTVEVTPGASDGERMRVPYDVLIVAAGSEYSYFGHDDWRPHAPELKSLENALDVRRRILAAFEAAEVEADPARRAARLTFAVVGAGPTGVEMAGQIAEIARDTLRHEFRRIDPGEARVLLVDEVDRVLPRYPATLSAKAERALRRLGVTVVTGRRVVGVDADGVTLRGGDGRERRRDGPRRPRHRRARSHTCRASRADRARRHGARPRARGAAARPPGRRARSDAAGPVCRPVGPSTAARATEAAVPVLRQGRRGDDRPGPGRRGSARGPPERARGMGVLARPLHLLPRRIPEPPARTHALGRQLRHARARRAGRHRLGLHARRIATHAGGHGASASGCVTMDNVTDRARCRAPNGCSEKG